MKIREIYVDISDRFRLQATTKGNQIKWHRGNLWIKADSMGYESIAEYLSTILESYIRGLKYVKYDLCTVKETGTGKMKTYNCCVSESFLTGSEYIVSAQRMIYAILGTEKAKDLVVKKTGVDLLAHTIEICNRCTGIDELTIYKYLSTICKLDALTLNEDRHLNNIAFIYDGKKYRLAPIFDNGMGLLADTESFPLNKGYSVWMQSVRARPFCSDFIEQALLFEDFGPLKLDYVNFVNEVNKIRIPERDKEFERAKGVLMRRLEETKGVVWDAI